MRSPGRLRREGPTEPFEGREGGQNRNLLSIKGETARLSLNAG